ncbi:SMI1/KNR4 family protein [Embleya sp. NPDC050154]|uniref:SMI1/KNR4 family protein n=1 Tax=Embleya sp. NPDC050154 TaxID=3363988 RepID=UPI00379C4FB6
MDEGDDDVLMAKLTARAWDPGRRFDTARVPTAWILEHHGHDRLTRSGDRVVSRAMNGTDLELPSHTEEVTAYYADAPRGPLFPPATAHQVDEAQSLLGRPLPTLLRRLYTEIGDGGFGPDSGLSSLRRGNRAPGHVHDWPHAIRDDAEHHRHWAPPSSWLHLAYGGCSMEWHLSLIAVDDPVLLYDADGWEGDWGQNPHDGLRHAMPLRRWLSIWANGGQVWDDVLADD